MQIGYKLCKLIKYFKLFPKIFFNAEMIRPHLFSCFFIHINKRLKSVTMLMKAFAVLIVRRMSEPTKA